MQQRQELEPVAHFLRISQHVVAMNELSSGGGVIAASQQDLSETNAKVRGQNFLFYTRP